MKQVSYPTRHHLDCEFKYPHSSTKLHNIYIVRARQMQHPILNIVTNFNQTCRASDSDCVTIKKLQQGWISNPWIVPKEEVQMSSNQVGKEPNSLPSSIHNFFRLHEANHGFFKVHIEHFLSSVFCTHET